MGEREREGGRERRRGGERERLDIRLVVKHHKKYEINKVLL